MERTTREWERMNLEEIQRILAADFENGLTHAEVEERARLYGKNKLEAGSKDNIFIKVLTQFTSPLVFILLGAGLVTLFLHEYLDTIVIFAALCINVIVGTFQEERASRAFEKLSESQERHAIVIREGKRKNILVEDLVPGDLVVLEGGYYVPGDARLIEDKDLQINEASLTGEWLAVSKHIGFIDDERPLAERFNMAWMGTLIESGYGKAIVVSTGMNTQMGMIAQELGIKSTQLTPLQRNIRSIAHFLTRVIVVVIAVIFLLGIVRGESINEMFLIAVAVAVSTVPSGLPAAVTVVLAIGMEKILRHGGLVRNLLAAETLGATTIILTDKTGTLTQATMKLTVLSTVESIQKPPEYVTSDDKFLLEAAVLASDAFFEEPDAASEKLVVHGRPIEKAIVLAGLELGVSKQDLQMRFPRRDYLRFESSRRFGASLHTLEGRPEQRLYATGAPETLLEKATHVYRGGTSVPFTDEDRQALQKVMQERSAAGMRLIGAVYKDVGWEKLPDSKDEEPANMLSESTFIGFMTFEDPLRTDVPEAITKVQGAGARVIMMTGDNPETARSIARQVGIIQSGDELVLHGGEIDRLTDEALYEMLQVTRVVARALPHHKMRIVQILKDNGEVVAMTGDGINDAPALKTASIGVAVGSGTEVAKEASDIVLINNSFAIIVAAIEEGRRIIDNLKKIVAYLLSSSFSEIFLIGSALIVGVPLPLLPTQILWTKIVEEGLMSFSFAFEDKDPNVMKRDPRLSESKNILTRELRLLIMVVSAVTSLFLVGLYFWLLRTMGEGEIDRIRTIMFVALSLDAIFFSFSLKSLDVPVWKINPFNNRFLLIALLCSLALLVAALTVPALKTLLSLTGLGWFEVTLLVGVGLFNLLTIEVAKYFLFRRT